MLLAFCIFCSGADAHCLLQYTLLSLLLIVGFSVVGWLCDFGNGTFFTEGGLPSDFVAFVAPLPFANSDTGLNAFRASSNAPSCVCNVPTKPEHVAHVL